MRRRWSITAGLLLSAAGCRGPEVGEPVAASGGVGASTSADGGASGAPSTSTGAFAGGGGDPVGGESSAGGGAGAPAGGGAGEGDIASGGTLGGGGGGGGAPAGGGTSGGAAGGAGAGGSPSGGADGGGGSGGTPVGGGGTGGGPGGGTGGIAGCTEGTTRGDCAVSRELCRGGSWVDDRTCFADSCAIVDCGDGTSFCCEGWDRVALNGYTYDLNDALVESFAETTAPVGIEATFDFNLDYDIGAISVYLNEPVAWERILAVLVDLELSGDPTPTPEISFELQGTNQGAVWWLEPAGTTYWITPADLYMPGVLYCFAAGCPASVDLVNIRVRPIGVESGGSGAARLAVYGVVLQLS